MKRYLLYVTLPYAYSILRPLEHEIRRRGGEAAWFVEEGCPVVLEEGEVRLGTIREAVAYNPVVLSRRLSLFYLRRSVRQVAWDGMSSR